MHTGSTDTSGGGALTRCTDDAALVAVLDDLEAVTARLAEVDVHAVLAPAAQAALGRVAVAANRVDALRGRLAARIEEAGSWRREGYRSPAEQLARTTGITEGEAKRQLAVAKVAAEQAPLGEALATGQLSASQAQILAPVFEHAPAAAAGLLASARIKDNRDLKARAEKAIAAATESKAREVAAWRQRRIDVTQDALTGTARLTATGPAGIINALAARIDRQVSEVLRTHSAKDHGKRTLTQRQFDAMTSLLGCGSLLTPPEGCDEQTPPDATLTPGGTATKIKLNYHLDLAAWRCNEHDTAGVAATSCHLQGIGPVPVAFAEALATNADLDTVVNLILKDGIDPKSIVSYPREIPDLLRLATYVRDGACAVPQCPGQGTSEFDHDPVRYEHEAPASLATGNHKCTPHHRQATHEGHTLLGDPGNRVWIDSEGNILRTDREDHPPIQELRAQRQAKATHINTTLTRPPPQRE